eukprot:308279-Pyramimonas_sp.AAC.1
MCAVLGMLSLASPGIDFMSLQWLHGLCPLELMYTDLNVPRRLHKFTVQGPRWAMIGSRECRLLQAVRIEP